MDIYEIYKLRKFKIKKEGLPVRLIENRVRIINNDDIMIQIQIMINKWMNNNSLKITKMEWRKVHRIRIRERELFFINI